MKESDLEEHSQWQKRKLEKVNVRKANVKIDEWAALEWICVDSPSSLVDE